MLHPRAACAYLAKTRRTNGAPVGEDASLSQWRPAAGGAILLRMDTLEHPKRPPVRDPANDLYTRACDLLFAAHEFRRAAEARGSAAAIAATVGAVEASLEALAEATASMRSEAAGRLSRFEDIPVERLSALSPELARRELSALVDALRSARRAAGVTRERVGPALAELTLA
jgi:hypothetical protein